MRQKNAKARLEFRWWLLIFNKWKALNKNAKITEHGNGEAHKQYTNAEVVKRNMNVTGEK